jgi:hypothetical protein
MPFRLIVPGIDQHTWMPADLVGSRWNTAIPCVFGRGDELPNTPAHVLTTVYVGVALAVVGLAVVATYRWSEHRPAAPACNVLGEC